MSSQLWISASEEFKCRKGVLVNLWSFNRILDITVERSQL